MDGKPCAPVVAAWIITSVTVGASDFWAVKNYTTWTDKEVAKMLTDSPWARPVTVSIADLSLASRVGGLSGGRIGTGGGPGRTGGGGGPAGDGAGNLGGGSFLAPPRQTLVTVRWSSALPIKHAARRRTPEATSSESLHATDDVEKYYRVSVVGLPLQLVQGVGSLNDLQQGSQLKRKNRPAIGAVDVRLELDGDHVTLEFDFPREEPILAGDAEIEFITSVGRLLEIKGKYRLKDMVYGGMLSL
jgi:hypothetical protein